MADVCEGYNYWLAVEDAVPIVFGVLGFTCLAQRVRARFPELTVAVYFAATILVVGSAFAGSIRKAFLAGGAGCDSLDWMQIPFFSAMPIGFGILAWAMLCVLQDKKRSFLPWAIFLAALFAFCSFIELAFPLIAVGGVLAVATGLECAILAKQAGTNVTAVLFAVYSVAILMLPLLGSDEKRGAVGHQWLEQGTNTVAQGLFALAAFRLLREYRRVGDRSVLVEN